jgi:hypothetical protein
MRETVTNLAVQLLYLVTHFTLADVVDTVLVAVVFLVVFRALARTRALQLLRGAITFAILGPENWCRPSSGKRVRPADTGRWPPEKSNSDLIVLNTGEAMQLSTIACLVRE